jgi:hypothetical protein
VEADVPLATAAKQSEARVDQGRAGDGEVNLPEAIVAQSKGELALIEPNEMMLQAVEQMNEGLAAVGMSVVNSALEIHKMKREWWRRLPTRVDE